MSEALRAKTPAGAAEAFMGMTYFHLGLIAVGILLALLVIWRGSRLRARRRRALAELEARGEIRYSDAPLDPAAEASPKPDAQPPAAAPPPAPPPAEPEAPAEPAPLADEPIAAAAPLDASPASLAADIAAPEPNEPEPQPGAGPLPLPIPQPGSGPLPLPAPGPGPLPGPARAPEAVARPAPPPRVAEASDDLTRMKGVGPRLAERLNGVGITRFAQIAALTPEEAAALDSKLGDFQGRLERDRWIEQAGFLASGDQAGFEAVFGKL